MHVKYSVDLMTRLVPRLYSGDVVGQRSAGCRAHQGRELRSRKNECTSTPHHTIARSTLYLVKPACLPIWEIQANIHLTPVILLLLLLSLTLSYTHTTPLQHYRALVAIKPSSVNNRQPRCKLHRSLYHCSPATIQARLNAQNLQSVWRI